MAWVPEVWVVVVPNPHDPDGNWIGPPENFDTRAGARGFVRDMGGDTTGRLHAVSAYENGWIVELPDLYTPDEEWVVIDSFETKRGAIAFVSEKFFGDSQGRVSVIDVMESLDPEDPDDPREWSPRKMRERS